MSALMLAIPLAFWPSFMDPANGPKWMLLSIAVPALFVFHRRQMRTHAHTWAILWFAWAALTLFWTPSVLDGLHALWKLGILLVLFALGTGLSSDQINRCLAAFAIGIGLNGILALAQVYGFNLIPQVSPPSGLFANKNYLAEAGVMALACLPFIRPRWLAATLAGPVAMAAFIPKSRGAILAAGVLLFVAIWQRSRYWAIFTAVAALNIALWWTDWRPAEYLAGDFSVQQRFGLWRETVAALTWFGHGIGSYWAAFQSFGAAVPLTTFSFTIGPDTPHNDMLLLLSDLGVGAVFPLAMAVCVWRSSHEQARYPLLAFAVCGLVAFPLLNPGTAAFTALIAGCAVGARHRLRPWELARGRSARRGFEVGFGVNEYLGDLAGRRGVPAVLPYSRSQRRDDRANAGGSAHSRADDHQARFGAGAE